MIDRLLSPEYVENTSGYFYILVAFLCLFTIILTLAENRLAWARHNFMFLDTKTGRGFFIIFIALMIP